jgi:hypothetical protein
LLPEIVASLPRVPNLVIEAAPGAGKTTRVPPALLTPGDEVLVLEFCIASAIVACSLFAQQEPVIRLDVQQVLVPVIVTGKKGHHVNGIRPSDFHIFEDGVQQEIKPSRVFSND